MAVLDLAAGSHLEVIECETVRWSRRASWPTATASGSEAGVGPDRLRRALGLRTVIEAGIPAGGLFSGAEGVKTAEEATLFGGTAGEAYDACYHAACDNITHVSTKALQELGDAAAHATLSMLVNKKGLFPDGSRTARSAAKVAPPTPGAPEHAAR